MTLKTKKYDQFKFRKDNRACINQHHIKRLINSINTRNLLEFRPIEVNEKFEIMDGQHRLLAAKALNLEIYYEIRKELQSSDIIHLNIAQAWTIADYMNYHCKNKAPEYLKLQEFLRINNLSLSIALNLLVGKGRDEHHKFKKGEFVFDQKNSTTEFAMIWTTIENIKKMKSNHKFVGTSRFWNAMILLVQHEDFNEKKWLSNLTKLIQRVSIRPTIEEYIQMISEVYNYKNVDKLELYWDT